MNELFAEIEAVLRGERDMKGERIISVECALADMAQEKYDELKTHGNGFAEVLAEGLADLSEEYDDGTQEEIDEYTVKLRALYERARAML